MAAPKGNKFWELRSKHGRDKLFATPELMFGAACEYFQWCEENPFLESEQVKQASKVFIDKSGTPTFPPNIIEIPRLRPFTIQGLCLYLDCNTEYFNHFEENIKAKNDKLSKDFCQVIKRIREIIYNQKFSGAASGFFNANIIARDLGLTDKTDLTTKGEKIESKTVIQWGDKQIPI